MRLLLVTSCVLLFFSLANSPLARAAAPAFPVVVNDDIPHPMILHPTHKPVKPVKAEQIRWRSPDAMSGAKMPADRPMILFVTTKGCVYCVRMTKETFNDRKVINQVSEKFTALKVDGGKYEKLTKKLGVKIFPTTAIVQSDGKVIDMLPGYHGPEDFMKRLEMANAKMAKVQKTVAAKRPVAVKK